MEKKETFYQRVRDEKQRKNLKNIFWAVLEYVFSDQLQSRHTAKM